VSLATPEKIRSLQRKLYSKAKAEPAFRFYQLYDKIWRADILAHAYALCRANGGAPGVDGETFAMIEAQGEEKWLAGLGQELAAKTYQPQPVRRVKIPKPDGGERLLGIPTLRDRVAQASAKLVLEPIFEADLDDNAYGYRPQRSALDAVAATHRATGQGHTDVVDADLTKYFDTIPHSDLLQSLARRISDRHVLWLIKLWLKAPVEERDGDDKRRMSGGKSRPVSFAWPVSFLLFSLLGGVVGALIDAARRKSRSRSRRAWWRQLGSGVAVGVVAAVTAATGINALSVQLPAVAGEAAVFAFAAIAAFGGLTFSALGTGGAAAEKLKGAAT